MTDTHEIYIRRITECTGPTCPICNALGPDDRCGFEHGKGKCRVKRSSHAAIEHFPAAHCFGDPSVEVDNRPDPGSNDVVIGGQRCEERFNSPAPMTRAQFDALDGGGGYDLNPPRRPCGSWGCFRQEGHGGEHGRQPKYDHTKDSPPHTHGGTDAPECTTCARITT